jgi:hypothetical protein
MSQNRYDVVPAGMALASLGNTLLTAKEDQRSIV